MMDMSAKGQVSLEAGVVLLIVLWMLTTLWFGGPLQQSVEKSTDTNGALLAKRSLDELASNVESVGISGEGARRDFVMHIPFDTVDIQYGDGDYTTYNGTAASGPHVTMSVLLYSDTEGNASQPYFVDQEGHPSWHRDHPGLFETSFFYVNVTAPLRFAADRDYFPFCSDADTVRKKADVVRGEGTRFVFFNSASTAPLTFCCEAGFNLNMYAERSAAKPSEIAIRSRQYYLIAGEWRLNA